MVSCAKCHEGNETHLLWVLTNVWKGADTLAIQLVLAASSKDLKVKHLVKVPNVVGIEVHSQCDFTIGRHDPPEVT